MLTMIIKDKNKLEGRCINRMDRTITLKEEMVIVLILFDVWIKRCRK